MVRDELARKVTAAVERLVADGRLPESEYAKVEISDTKSPEHGDFACNFAMVAAKSVQMNPREVAELIAERLRDDPDLAGVAVAGPGFINLTLSERLTARAVRFVLDGGASFCTASPERPLKINVEYVSVNPNGPITVGSGRGAAYGSALCNVLEAAGHRVHREYYINDGVNSEQMRLFAESVKALCEGRQVPENGYKGDYVQSVADELKGFDEPVDRLFKGKFDLKAAWKRRKWSLDPANATAAQLLNNRSFEDSRAIPARLAMTYGAVVLKVSPGRFDLGCERSTPSITHSLSTALASQVVLHELPKKTIEEILRVDYGFAMGVGEPMAKLHDAIFIQARDDKATRIRFSFPTGPAEHVRVHFTVGDAESEATTVPRDLAAELRYLLDYSIKSNRDGPTDIELLCTPLKLKARVERDGDELRIDLEGCVPCAVSNGHTKDTVEWYQAQSQQLMVERQQADLEAFGVTFDTWFSEQSLHDGGSARKEINHLVKSMVADDHPCRAKVTFGKKGEVEDVEHEKQAQEGGGNTLWLRSTKFGDDQDRVLRRGDGRLTYIASDVAYHKDKFNRPVNADKLITVLGPDHHGYVARLHAVVAAGLMERSGLASRTFDDMDSRIWYDACEKRACQDALKLAKVRLEVLIFQLVRFVKDGKPAPMRKRDGNIYALIDLMDEIGERAQPDGSTDDKRRAGRDVARFFYLMRHHDTTFDFDLGLAEKQSEENPVFYAQY
ncbi:MAG: hypothetical protein IH945_07805, partial [Armatimonadetes bacterium]|nr:hypothetical protein [Armatimonadota bacterium]